MSKTITMTTVRTIQDNEYGQYLVTLGMAGYPTEVLEQLDKTGTGLWKQETVETLITVSANDDPAQASSRGETLI